jgi:hypothetical protein
MNELTLSAEEAPEQPPAKADSSATSCSRCVELEQELAAIKIILADPVAVHANTLRGTIAKLSDANVKHVYPHLFENK